jgi:hypothetical protein
MADLGRVACCPCCCHELWRAIDPKCPQIPPEGNVITVCIHCRGVLIFGEECCTLREMTDDEWAALSERERGRVDILRQAMELAAQFRDAGAA